MKSFVMKMVLPAAAFVLASAGAVSTSSASANTAQASVQGWKRIAPFNCQQVRLCNNQGGPVCLNGTDTMYAKPTPSSDCTQILTHKP